MANYAVPPAVLQVRTHTQKNCNICFICSKTYSSICLDPVWKYIYLRPLKPMNPIETYEKYMLQFVHFLIYSATPACLDFEHVTF